MAQTLHAVQARRAKNYENLPVYLRAKHAVQCMALRQSRRVWISAHRAIRNRGNLLVSWYIYQSVNVYSLELH